MKRYVQKVRLWIAPRLHIILGYGYDTLKFLSSCSDFGTKQDKNKALAVMTRHAHGLEKAFSLPHTRAGFGRQLALRLASDCTDYLNVCGEDVNLANAFDVLIIYQAFQAEHGAADDSVGITIDALHAKIRAAREHPEAVAGVYTHTREDWLKRIENFDFASFVHSRASVRSFSDKPVDPELLQKAITIASDAPSACNRQPWHVRAYFGEQKDHALQFQMGNRGFGENINVVLLVTARASFYTYRERHGAQVDGGLFSMNLMYALHDLGLASCPLNLYHTYKQERALRRGLQIDQDEEAIMMIGVGHLKDEFSVAVSAKRAVVLDVYGA